MYFLTAQDPNYTIKGSRDPLGFQVIWQEAGRRLIPHLSTVSGNIKDFQILCLAHQLEQELGIKDENFESFFLLLEQFMAYVRYERDYDLKTKTASYPIEGFNGIDRIRKYRNEANKEVKIGLNEKQLILSNQKAYGIWGKYNRPFTDMLMSKDASFAPVFSGKINTNQDFIRKANNLKNKTDNHASIRLDALPAFYSLLEKPTGQEKELFIKYLLQDKMDNECYRILLHHPCPERYTLFDLINYFSSHSGHPQFLSTLSYIANTEKVICPLNRIFRYLQTQSYWTFRQIQSDERITKWRNEIDPTGMNETVIGLAGLLQLENIDLVKGLVKRNEEISDKRNSSAWIRINGAGVEINHYEGAFKDENYNPIHHNDNFYFLTTFISLFNQLQ